MSNRFRINKSNQKDLLETFPPCSSDLSHDKEEEQDYSSQDGPPALESVTEATEDEALLEIATPALTPALTLDEEEESNVSSDDRQTVVVSPPEAAKPYHTSIPLVVSAASKWRAAVDMGDSAGTPSWRRAAVRAVLLQVRISNSVVLLCTFNQEVLTC